MDVSSVTNPGAGGVSTPTDKTKLGKDDFLKLLLAQLSQQDPTSPADSQAFVAQLAQFANVEQLQGVNEGLQTMLVAQTSSNQTQTVGLLGKDVRYKTDSCTFDGSPVQLHGNLSKNASTVSAAIVDSTGKTVRTIQLRDVASGEISATWDGLDDKGNPLPKGDYKVRLTAADEKGGNIPVDVYGTGRVTGISYAKGYPELQVGTATLTLSNIIAVTEPTQSEKN
ncbi:MAG: flagellar hook assembly protein FlgD [Archangiaceae bacterium]|nr:flagellar hook assembly protein FlgD [Archangiaceae bacterium]